MQILQTCMQKLNLSILSVFVQLLLISSRKSISIFLPPLTTPCPVIFLLHCLPYLFLSTNQCNSLGLQLPSRITITLGKAGIPPSFSLAQEKEILITTLRFLKCKANCFLCFPISCFCLCRWHTFWLGLTCMTHFQGNTWAQSQNKMERNSLITTQKKIHWGEM